MAQDYELNWWKGYQRGIEWYRAFSQEIEDLTGPFLDIGPETRILEIGSGPAGALTFLRSENKYAIDPLEDFFSSREEWVRFRDPGVQYRRGRGEELPYEEGFFDLIIIDNVLDHCENPMSVLDETNRVLRKGGIICLRQNLYNRWGRLMRRMMEVLTIDRGHPHTFGKADLVRHFRARRWEPETCRETGYLRSWTHDLRSLTVKGFLESVTFVTRNRTLFVLRKQS